MKLINLIAFFRKGGTFEDFCQSQNLNAESEVIEIFMEKPLDVESDLAFFEIEQTGGKSSYSQNNIEYANLFDFYYFLDAIEESMSDVNSSYTDYELAQRLFQYAIKDA